MFADIALAVEEHWSCVNTVNHLIREHSAYSEGDNHPSTLRWLDKDTIQLEILKYRRSELNSMYFINGAGAVYINTNEYPYLVILLEAETYGGDFNQLRVWYYKCTF